MHQSIYLDMDRSLAGMVIPLGILDGEGKFIVSAYRRIGVSASAGRESPSVAGNSGEAETDYSLG